MTTPVIAVLETGTAIADALRVRFGADYEVIACRDADALAGIDASRRVALLMAPVRGGMDALARARDRHPGACRVAVVDVGDIDAQPDVRRALTLGAIDAFCGSTWASPEEELYPVAGEALRLWARDHEPRQVKAVVIDGPDGRGAAIRTFLVRNAVWTSLITAGTPEADALVREHGLVTDDLPAVVLWDGRVLTDPPLEEVATSLGATTRPGDGTYDVVVVGAGPAGLASAAYAASEGLRVVCVEPLAVGGQAGTTSKIRNYLGFRWGISGAEFAERAARQAEELGADYVFTRRATALRPDGDERIVTLDNGDEIVARAVVLACGVTYQRLGIPDVDDLTGSGVFYGASAAEARSMGGLRAFVLGGGNSAGQIATFLATSGADTTLVTRGPELGPPMTDYLVEEVTGTSGLTVRTETTVVGAGDATQLRHLVLRDTRTEQDETVPADALFVFIGARPHTDWLEGAVDLDDHGFVLTGADLGEGSDGRAYLETSVPGVFAAGDVRARSVKRVAAAVGEGSTATLLAREYLTTLAG